MLASHQHHPQRRNGSPARVNFHSRSQAYGPNRPFKIFRHTHPSSRVLCPGEVIDLIDSDDELMLRLPPVRIPDHSPSARASLGGIVDLGSPELSEDEDNDLARAIHLSMQPADVTCNKRGLPVLSTAPSMPHTPTIAGALRNASLPTSAVTITGTTTTLVNRFNDKTYSSSKANESHLNALDEVRIARLRHFASSPTRGY